MRISILNQSFSYVLLTISKLFIENVIIKNVISNLWCCEDEKINILPSTFEPYPTKDGISLGVSLQHREGGLFSSNVLHQRMIRAASTEIGVEYSKVKADSN